MASSSSNNMIEDRIVKNDRLMEVKEHIQNFDWKTARGIMETDNIRWTAKLDDEHMTALHFAVGEFADSEAPIKDILLELGNNELLVATLDINGRNPAHTASYYSNTEALMRISDSNPKCFFKPDNGGGLAILYPLVVQDTKTFLYLFDKMKSCDEFGEFFNGEYGLKVWYHIIDAGIVDVAYALIDDHPSLATKVYENHHKPSQDESPTKVYENHHKPSQDESPLESIIRKPELFCSGTPYNLWQRFIYHFVPIENNLGSTSLGSTDTADEENQKGAKKDKRFTKYNNNVISKIWAILWAILLHVPLVKHLKGDKVKHNTTIKLLRRICEGVEKTYCKITCDDIYTHAIHLAVENNTVEAVDVLATCFKGLHDQFHEVHSMFIWALQSRSEKVFSYVLHHERNARFDFSLIEVNGGNILHFAGCLPPEHKRNAYFGPAFEMQRECQWFEKVKEVVRPAQIRKCDTRERTPEMVFKQEHEKMRKDGEEWMKKTADSCTIKAALIMTMVFAAAITIPGGNDSATGKPFYETKASLIIFAISVAISFFTSTTSFLLFLSILTARYKDEDFLYMLPKRLIFGLVMLFVSMTSMMIAFSAALYIMFGQEKQMILITIAALACLPIATFAKLQFPLLFELISSTYGHGIFGKKKYYRQSRVANKKKRA